MTDSTLEIQKAVVAALKADGAVAALVGARVYDQPPQDPVYPFVSFGPVQGAPWDTDVGLGWEAMVQIDSWSRKPGRVEAAQIAEAVRSVLHRSVPSLDSQTVVLALLDFSTILRDPDGVTSHAVQRFRFLTHE